MESPSEIIAEFGYWQPRPAIRRLKMHRNDGLELIHIGSGHLRWVVDGVSESIPPNSAFFTMPWQEHGSSVDSDTGTELHYLVLPLQGGAADWIFHPGLGLQLTEADMALLRQSFASQRHCFVSSERFRHLLSDTVTLLYQPKPSTLVLRGLLLALVAEMQELIILDGDHAPPDPSLQRVQTWIARTREHPLHEQSLEDAAASCGLGRSRFAKLVQHETGDSPIRFRNRLRIDLACTLLKTSKRDITDIALSCGFSSSQYFARAFKNFMACDPSSWRKQQQ